MFEQRTFESLLQMMLDRVPDTLDKREGSIIYDALAPAAAELQTAYIALDMVLDEGFADTASWEYLVKRCAERGILPAEATAAVVKGTFEPASLTIPTGSRFNLDELNYVVADKMEDGVYRLTCETPGLVANGHTGTLVPIDYIEGLQSAVITEVLIPGEDEEGPEALRNRYYDSLSSEAFGGNVADYKAKVNALAGVGGVKVYPTWAGGGTVKLVIIDSDYRAPSDTLVEMVQNSLDPIEKPGAGMGLAPIGHVVAVTGVAAKTINISTHITYQQDWSWADVQAAAEAAVDTYFAELAQDWAAGDSLVVRISQVETRLLNVAGVLDIADTAINGAARNLVLGPDEIPTRGVLTDGTATT